MYLDFAELQALNRSPMYMKDWIFKLDDFLQVASPRDTLSHGGTVSHKIALNKARKEYQRYQEQLESNTSSLVEEHFLQITKEIEQVKKKS